MLMDVGHIQYILLCMWALSKHNSLDLQTFQNQNTSFIYEQNGRRWRESCHPLSIEIVQYNARIKNATRCNFECFHLLLAQATFLITHPYYYFVLFVLFAFTSVSLLFWSHAQILKYRSICGERSARTACHKYFSSYGPSGFQHSHTHAHLHTHTDTWRGETATEAGAGKIIKNNSGHKIGGNRTRERPMQKSFFIGPV